MRVRLPRNNSTLAKQKSNPNLIPFNCSNFDSTHASRVYLNQNQLTPAQHFNTFQLNTTNHIIFDCDFDPRARFTPNKLTLAGHNHLLLNQPRITYNSNALFAIHTSKHQINSHLASHSTKIINTPLQLEPQIAVFETQNTEKASLPYENNNQFNELSHFNFSITIKPQIPSPISTQKSHTLNFSRGQLTHNKKSLFAQTQCEIQLSSHSINLIEN